MGLLRVVGENRARAFRVLQYAGLLTAPSVLLTVVKVYGGEWYWVLLVIPLVALAWFLDPRIFRGEIDYTNRNNTEWQDIRQQVSEIHKLLKAHHESRKENT